MSVTEAIRKIRVFGFKGVLNYLQASGRRRAMKRCFQRNLKRYPVNNPEAGVTVIADFHGKTSLAKVMRDLVIGLHNSGMPFQALNLPSDDRLAKEETIDALLTPPDEFRIAKYRCIVERLGGLPLPQIPGIRPYQIVFWEFDSGIEEAYPHLWDSGKGIIAMSDFNRRYYQSVLPPSTKVVKITYPLRTDFEKLVRVPSDEVRARLGLRQHDFVVFYNFGLGSARKNPEGCIRAFAEAFPHDSDAKLVLKTSYSEQFPSILNGLRVLANDLGVADRLVIVDNYLDESEVYSLTNACNLYFAPHRGEGLGLGIAEAMSLGKPVVVTDWSAPTEFCNKANSFPIGFELTRMQPSEFDRHTYAGVTRWAEPKLADAICALRKCHDNRDYARDVGLRGRQSVLTEFSSARFGDSVASLFEL